MTYEPFVLDQTILPQLVDLLNAVGHDLPRPFAGRVDVEAYARKLLSYGVVVAVRDGDQLVGLCGGYSNDTTAARSVITIIGVRASYRQEGLGSLLIEDFERRAIDAGMRILELETHHTNKSALAFYEKHGYQLVAHAAEGNVVMRKVLVGLCAQRPNILLTSVGRRSYLVSWFKEAIAGAGEVHVVNSDAQCPAFRQADKATQCPIIYSDDYLPFLLDYCQENRIGAILSLFDIDIPVLASARHDFMRRGCFPVVASEYAAQICNDKYLTTQKLSEAGLNVIRSFVSLDDCKTALASGELSFPLILKPRWGMGSIGVFIAETPEELEVLYGMVLRKIRASYLRYESADDMDNAVLIQEMIDGREYGLDVINDLNGQYAGVVVRRKLAMRSGETDVAVVEPVGEEFVQLARTISSLVGHPGNLDMDVFQTAEGELYVLEMNARFGGGYPFSHCAGVRLPQALVSWLSGEQVDSSLLTPSAYGTYMKDITIVPFDVAG